MTYYTCLSCPPHSTIDHDLHGKGACLLPDCPCQKMVDGAVFIKPVRQVSEEINKKVAEKREEGML